FRVATTYSTSTAVVISMMIAEADAMVGSTSRVIDEYMVTGSVRNRGSLRKIAITVSSNAVTKANRNPASTPGSSSGSVILKITDGLEAPSTEAASSNSRWMPTSTADTVITT